MNMTLETGLVILARLNERLDRGVSGIYGAPDNYTNEEFVAIVKKIYHNSGWGLP